MMNDKEVYLFLGRGRLSRRSTASMLVMLALSAGVTSWGAVSALAEGLGGRRHPAKAIAARTISVHETMHTDEVISHKGNSEVNERGRGKGTFDCPSVMKITISYTNGTADMNCMTTSGNVNGRGKVSFFTAGPTATFTGTLAVEHGTGKYLHASGQFHVEGSMVRKTFALSATLNGLMTY